MRIHKILPLLVTVGAIICFTAVAAQSRPMPAFRDLDHNGRMDPYENPQLSVDARVDDLVGRMTLPEKIGAMMHGTLPGVGGSIGHPATEYDLSKAEALISNKGVNSFLTRLAASPEAFANQNNQIQRIAERSRLGIPVTISTDPRNHFQAVFGASSAGGGFSLWPEPLGLAAISEPLVVRRFGDVVRREYRAVGIQMALSPQADLATEPRWARGAGTFGSNPKTVSALVGAYIAGLQNGTRGVSSVGVAAVVKHWVGYGAEPDGFDAHNYYGRTVRLSNSSFRQHVAAFSGAFAANVAAVMPTYPIVSGVNLNGKPLDPVGAGYNGQLLTGLLRGENRYRGLIVSDWAITNDCPASCKSPTKENPQTAQMIAMPWGVEQLSRIDRFAKGVNAGLDQFGGADDPAPLIEAVRTGKVSEARIDQSVRRIMRLKFALGLFDNPFVDPAAAAKIVSNPADRVLGEKAQSDAQVLLQNRGNLIPMAPTKKVWLYGIDAVAARNAGLNVVSAPAMADIAIIRVATPSEKLHPYALFGNLQNEGRLDFREDDPSYQAVLRASGVTRVILAVDMDRPAILTNLFKKVDGILAVFGASDAALLDIVTGKAQPRGRLPFELPSSMAAVMKQDPALPDDSAKPLFSAGAGSGGKH